MNKKRLLEIIKEEITSLKEEEEISPNDLMYSDEDASQGSEVAKELISTKAPFIRVSTHDGKMMWDFEMKNQNGKIIFVAYQVETKRNEPVFIDGFEMMKRLEQNLGLDRGLGNNLIWNPKRKNP
ncbi:MAG: hypothetical protein HC875_20745 [Anaerolineales bacterium]|nr:hypothetical protein [Anaerolineales bacterium]